MMEIEKEAEKVLKGLSDALGEIDLEETYYVVEDINVTRKDGKPKLEKDFRKEALKNAPSTDSEGNYKTEVGKWVE